nr:group II truncated hemoglobin [Stenotrophobium rhamnosiphilum]
MPDTLYEALGGEAAIRKLVDRFYDLMATQPEFVAIRILHPPDMSGSRDKLFWFLCGWMGGPNHFIERFGHPRLRARHLPFSIGIVERDQWLACMFMAMDQCEVPQDLRLQLDQSFTATADWMRNQAPQPQA